MNKFFTCQRASKKLLLSLSLAALSCLSLGRAIANPIPNSLKQPSNSSKMFDRPAAGSIASNSQKLAIAKATDFSPGQRIHAQGTAAGRSLEVQEIRGTVIFKGRQAQTGDRLVAAGDEIVTGPNSTVRLAIDNYIGIVEVAEKTAVRISNLSGGGEPDTSIFVSRGRVRLSVGKTDTATPTATTSKIILPDRVASLNTFAGIGQSTQIAQQRRAAKPARVRVETPEGVAGVRGTSFGVSVGPDGKTGVDTIEGAVGVSSRRGGEEVVVNRGNWTAVFPQTGVVASAATPRVAQLKVRSLFRLSGNTYRFRGEINPMDIVYVNDREIKVDRQGKFNIQGVLPLSRRLKIVVRGPSVRERHYELAVP
ncbi:MAG: FecR family protein [Microcoleus sp.]